MGWNCMKSTRRVLGYLLLHSLAPHCSLRSRAPLRSFVRPRTPLHSFVRSLAHSLQSSWESDLCLWIECIDFMRFQTTASRWSVAIVCSFVIVQITILWSSSKSNLPRLVVMVVVVAQLLTPSRHQLIIIFTSCARSRAHGKEVSAFEMNASFKYNFDP